MPRWKAYGLALLTVLAALGLMEFITAVATIRNLWIRVVFLAALLVGMIVFIGENLRHEKR